MNGPTLDWFRLEERPLMAALQVKFDQRAFSPNLRETIIRSSRSMLIQLMSRVKTLVHSRTAHSS